MLVLILGMVLYFVAIYIALPLAIIFSIIAFVQYMRIKNYKVFKNIAIILYIPALIAGILYLIMM